jgi:hypothetical protein
MDIFRTLIVQADDVVLAREIAASFGTGGEGMWTTPISATGLYPATHYISSGFIPPEFAYLITDAQALYDIAINQGVDCTLAQVEELVADSDVTQEEPFPAMARLGLGLVIINDESDV